jgi:hypothetical protein
MGASMGRTREDRIRELQERADQLTARAKLLAQQETAKQRSLETRRRILMGACLEELKRRGDVSEGQVLSWLDGYLTRDGDRVAFGLPLLQSHASVVRREPPPDGISGMVAPATIPE